MKLLNREHQPFWLSYEVVIPPAQTVPLPGEDETVAPSASVQKRNVSVGVTTWKRGEEVALGKFPWSVAKKGHEAGGDDGKTPLREEPDEGYRRIEDTGLADVQVIDQNGCFGVSPDGSGVSGLSGIEPHDGEVLPQRPSAQQFIHVPAADVGKFLFSVPGGGACDVTHHVISNGQS